MRVLLFDYRFVSSHSVICENKTSPREYLVEIKTTKGEG